MMTTYIFRWNRHGRKGQRCVMLARGTMNSCLVRFEDGYMMVTSRNALGIKVPFNPTVATETASARPMHSKDRSATHIFAPCSPPSRSVAPRCRRRRNGFTKSNMTVSA
jgi:hypothetical protein